MHGRNTRQWLFAITACFAVRLFFYAAMLPLWEGYDEWAHFAVIQRMALRGELLVARDAPVSRQIEASLQLAPVPWELRSFPPPALTDDAYWQLAPLERTRRQTDFSALPQTWATQDARKGGHLPAYEALQPPLYYWLMAPFAFVLRGVNLGTEVLLLRWLACGLASFTIPLCFLLGRSIFRSDALALGCAAIPAVMPEFALDVARVGNECLAVLLFTLLTWLIVEAVRGELTSGRALAMGITLGLGLLTKAYFLTALVPVTALLIYMRSRQWWRVCVPTVAIAGWWYIHNIITTGTVSGMNEAVMLHGKSSLLHRATEIHWPAAADTILMSHLWFGGWSSLTIRSWMYHVFYLLIVTAAVGLIRWRKEPAVWMLLVIYAAFWLGQFYNVLLLFVAKGMATSMGWYMYAVVGAEVVLCVAGLRAIWATSLVLFGILDLYTVHAIALPYYTGLIAHRANGSIAALHVTDLSRMNISEMFTRLSSYKGLLNEPMLLALWIAYLVATAGVVGISCLAKDRGVKSQDQQSL